MRLDKYLSDSGLSRARAREAITAGRVRVNGEAVKSAGYILPAGARVFLDGAPVEPTGHLHIMLNKPSGVVTAQRDGRFQTVFDLLPENLTRRDLCAVGRLDRDTTGLLLLTTDGQLAHRLISPRFTVEKVYRARVAGALTREHVDIIARGVALSDFTARPARLEILEPDLGELTVTEGKYHQVKRMFGALGCPVEYLHRVRVGPLFLDEALKPGEARPLTHEEARALYKLTRMEAMSST